MSSRDQSVLGIRPELNLETEAIKENEIFQNQVFRPILKFQHDIIVQWFDDFVKKTQLDLTKAIDKRDTLSSLLSKNISSKSEIMGIIIGLFTANDFEYFQNNKKELSKRMIQMLIERYLSENSN